MSNIQAASTDFLDDLLGEEYAKVLIVCHGGTSQLLLEMLLEENENISESENCSISIVEVRNNTIELVKFNDISYLK